MINFGHELVSEFNSILMYPCVSLYMLVTKRQGVDSDEAYIILERQFGKRNLEKKSL